jgi:hypothetical protein
MFGRRDRAREQPSPVEPVLAMIERAKANLVSAVPSPRGVPGRPLAEALLAFEEGLSDAAGSPNVPAPWRSALDESLRRAERLRLDAPELDYEGLVEVLAGLLAPLEALEG